MKYVFICLALATCVAASNISSPQQAADLVFNEILGGEITGKSVLSLDMILSTGERVGTWHEEVEVPFDGYLVLIDDMVYANWEHPCRWVFVSPEGEMAIIKLTTPPNAIGEMTTEYTCVPAHTQVRSDILETFIPNPRISDAEYCKALLISGGANQYNNHIRYYGDIQFIYLTLTQDYGYTNDDIIICFADGLDPAPDQSGGANSDPDLDGNGTDDFDYDATNASVTAALAEMATLAESDDHVLIFATDHGGSGKDGVPEVYLNLWNSETLDDDLFGTYLNTFDCASIHVVMEQCYSGGFMGEVVPAPGQEPRTFSSAANGYESSWAGATYPDYDEWCYWWTSAMHGFTPTGGTLAYDPDVNSDGYVDYGEAWDCAFNWDSYAQSGQEHPQYDDDPDSCGEEYYLGGAIPGVGVTNNMIPLLPVTGGITISGNPVSSVSTVIFNLEQACGVDISVYDISGHAIENLVSEHLAAGEHAVIWKTDDLAAGVYLVRLRAGNSIESVRAVKY